MATKVSQKKNTNDTSVYQKEIKTWTLEDLEKRLLACERNLHLDIQGDDKRMKIFTALANKWLPATDERDSQGLPININKDDLERMIDNHRRTNNLTGFMLAHAEFIGVIKNETLDINGDAMTIERRIKRFNTIYRDIVEKFMSNDSEYKVFNKPLEQNVDVDFDIEKEASPYQKLLIYLLRTAYKNGYRRYRDQCCKEIRNTRAWKTIKEIKEFVYDETQKEDNAEQWMNLTNRGGMASDVIRHLSNCKDIQFPEIKKDRHVWSFQNGLLDARPTPEHKFAFYDYNSQEFEDLDPTLVSCKYFDAPFDPYDSIEDWYDIPTPVMQSVLDYQKFDPVVCRWIFVFMGRLCYDINELDGWQIIPFLKGIAGTGKSTLIKLAKKFYECEDVSVLSNNIEKKFGLQSIYKGFMFVSPEIKGDLQLEQAEFQSMVSGEDVSVARKNETATTVQWKTPGFLGGNEVPNWKDNSGSILRRLATVNFGKQIAPEDADPHLEAKLEVELPIVLCKCLRAYLDYSNKYSDKDIWNVLPKYFKDIQNQVANVTNALRHFMSSEDVVFGPQYFIPQSLFVTHFTGHCKKVGITKVPVMHPDFYAGPFSSKDIEVRKDSKIYQGQAFTNQTFFFGVDVKLPE